MLQLVPAPFYYAVIVLHTACPCVAYSALDIYIIQYTIVQTDSKFTGKTYSNPFVLSITAGSSVTGVDATQHNLITLNST